MIRNLDIEHALCGYSLANMIFRHSVFQTQLFPAGLALMGVELG